MFSRRVFEFSILFCVAFVVGCQTQPTANLAPPPKAEAPAPIVLPLISNSDGLLMVQGAVNDFDGLTFIVDTGASISSLITPRAKALGSKPEEGSPQAVALLRGMIDTAEQQVSQIDRLTLGTREWVNLDVMILDTAGRYIEADGIIGMDILADYIMVVDRKSASLSLYAPGSLPLGYTEGWSEITLMEDPEPGTDYRLHFAEARLHYKTVRTLIDTGSSFSAMNWAAARRRLTLRRLYSKLRDDWKLAGAVGAFKPQARTIVDLFRIGDHSWDAPTFYILELAPLDVLGADDRPFIIAGSNLLRTRSFVMDFPGDMMWLEQPKPRTIESPPSGSAPSPTKP